MKYLALTTLGLMGLCTIAPCSLAAMPRSIAMDSITKNISDQNTNRFNKNITADSEIINSEIINSEIIAPESNQTTPNPRQLKDIKNWLAQTDSVNGANNLPTNNRINDTTWRILGQPVMTFDLPPAGTVPSVLNPDTIAPEGAPQNTATPNIPNASVIRTLTPQQQRQRITERITGLNQRLAEIVFNLDPAQAWPVDVQPVIIMVMPPEPPNPNPLPQPVSPRDNPAFRQTKPTAPQKPKPKPKPIPVVQSATIRLAGLPLIEVTAEDVANQNATSIMDLANAWASALRGLLDSSENRQRLFAVAGLPETISFQNTTYGLNPQVALDRGLFRTNGERTQGFIVFWEVPPDNNAYKIPPGNYVFNDKNRRIFLLNRLMQFIPYGR